LDQFYFLEKLKLYCQYLSRSNTLPANSIITTEELKLIYPILKELEKNDFENPAIKIFLAIKDLLIESKQQIDKDSNQFQKVDNLFKELESLIKKHQNSFENNELIEIYSYLSVLAIKQYNYHQFHYLPISITLYNKILTLLFEHISNKDEILNSNLFKNIVVLSLQYPQVHFWNQITTPYLTPKNKLLGFKDAEEWVEAFINNYQNNLLEADMDKFAGFARAKLLFAQSDFSAAYKLIKKVDKYPKGLYLNLDIKTLYLQILYEINDDRVLNKLIEEREIEKILDSYRGLLKDNRHLHYQKPFFDAFHKTYGKLYLFYKNYNYTYVKGDKKFLTDKHKLRNLLNAYSFVSYKQWLEDKYEFIIKDKAP